MTESLQLLIPDDWAGIAQRIEVEGTQGGAPVAAGAVVVTPIAGQEVTAIVTLVDPSCDLVCSLGSQQCDGDGVVTCELGGDGCPTWSAATACPSEAPYCSSGSCASSCTDECISGATICEGSGSVRTAVRPTAIRASTGPRRSAARAARSARRRVHAGVRVDRDQERHRRRHGDVEPERHRVWRELHRNVAAGPRSR